MKQKICPTCDGKLKGNYCPFCHKIVRKPMEWDVHYYLNERHPDWETGCEYHSASESEPVLEMDAYPEPEQKTDFHEIAQPETETYQDTNPYRENPYQRAPKKPSKSEKPKKSSGNRITKIVVIVVCLWIGLQIVIVIGSYLFSEGLPDLVSDPIPETGFYIETELAEESAWTENLPAESDEWIKIEEETEELVSGEEWSEENIIELTDEQVMEIGEACTAYNHIPVQAGEFSGLVEEYLQEHHLSVADTMENSMNSIYPEEIDGKPLSTYGKYFAWYVLEPGMEETDYRSAVYLNSDTASGEIHWVEIGLGDPDAAYEMVEWAAETLGELAGYPEPQKTAKQIGEELRACEPGEEWNFLEVGEFEISIVEFDGITTVTLEEAYRLEP